MHSPPGTPTFSDLVRTALRQQRVAERAVGRAIKLCASLAIIVALPLMAARKFGPSPVQSRPQELHRKALSRSQTQKPRISFVLLSFRHAENVAPLCRSLGCSAGPMATQLRPMAELLVMEDGGGRTRELWHEAAKGSEGYTRVLESDNLHEIRAYHKGFMEAKGDLLVMLQDDDLPPPASRWLFPALKLFDLHPRLGLLSCTDGFTSPEVFGNHFGRPIPIPTEDNRAKGAPFMFVVGANSAPVFYRAKAYQEVGGFNHSYSGPGEPGMGFETEISFRMWKAGWQSAIMDCGSFLRGVGGHGSMGSTAKRQLRKRIWATNQNLMHQSFSQEDRRGIAATVEKLNAMPPIQPRPSQDMCLDLKSRTDSKSDKRVEKLSKKGAMMLRPWLQKYLCSPHPR